MRPSSRTARGVLTSLLAAALLPASAARAGSGGPAAAAPDRVENSVVRVFSTMRYPDPYKPWTKQSPQEVTGSGVVIEGKRILTNAHLVLYATQVQVQANQAADKISARVEAIAPGIDLAVLALEDAAFFDAHRPMSCARALPEVSDAVMAYGFPTGGSGLSITKGIVSRIEFTGYEYPVSGLRIQIDAAINPGNSGGPAIAGDRMIGLAFAHLGGAEAIGYIVPCEEIELFLADVADGRYDGKPAMYDDLQTLENEALRGFLKLDRSVQGIVVHRPHRTDAAYPLREWDVITRIGDEPIDDQGMVKLGPNLRVRFPYFIQRIAKKGTVPLTVVRAGKTLPVQLPVSPVRPMVIPDLSGSYPSYFVWGPLVFSNATSQYVSGLARENKNLLFFTFVASPVVTRRGDEPAFPGEELVVVASPFLPHKLSKGYSNPVAEVVKAVNGIPVKNLRHLVEILRDTRDEFVTFAFTRRGGESIVFRRKEAVAATDEILGDNGIRSQGTPDTMAVWKTAAAR